MFLFCTILPHCCSLTDTHTGHEAWEQTELTPQWCREFTEFGVDSSAPDCAAHILVNIVDRDLSFFHCAAQGLGLGGKRQCRLLFAGHVKRFDYYSLNFVKLVVAEISVSLHLCNNTISKEELYDYTTNDVLTFTHKHRCCHIKAHTLMMIHMRKTVRTTMSTAAQMTTETRTRSPWDCPVHTGRGLGAGPLSRNYIHMLLNCF